MSTTEITRSGLDLTISAGAPAMVQGLGEFDGGRSTMGQGSAAVAQGMADMEKAMQMMEQGSTEMMSSGGEMGGMM